jgi:hypothetical protein
MMTQRRLTAVALLTLALCGFFVTRRAGAVASQSLPVVVDRSISVAYGGAGTARNSTDGNQEIACWTQASGETLTVLCYATDKDGNSASCTTTTGDLGLVMDGVVAATENASISFQWDGAGNCTAISVDHHGWLEPKRP